MGFIPHPDLTPLINAFKKFVAMRCAPTPLVYIELAAVSAIKAFYTVAEPDLREAITQLTGRSAFCHVKGGIKRATGIGSAPNGVAKKFLFPIIGGADLATWWLFLFGVGTDGLADFFSGAARMDPCNDPDRFGHYGYGDIAIGGWPVYPDGRWQTGPQWRTLDWPDTPAAGPRISVRPGHQGLITGTCEVGLSFSLTTIPFSLRVRWEDDDQNIIATSEPDFDPKLVRWKTTIHGSQFNGSGATRVMLLEISIPGSFAGATCGTKLDGYGYSKG